MTPRDSVPDHEAGEPSASNDIPPLKRAIYVVHVSSVAQKDSYDFNTLDDYKSLASERNRFITVMDDALKLFEAEPKFQHFVCAGETCSLEYYLSIRPEHFERIEQLVRDGRLLIGPWYIQTNPRLGGIEAIIRNLLIGLQTADAIGRAMKTGYLLTAEDLHGQLPQILKSFGIETAIVVEQLPIQRFKSYELVWEGIDRTQIILGSEFSSFRDDDMEAKAFSESGHLLHLEEFGGWSQSGLERGMFTRLPQSRPDANAYAFHSNPLAYAQAIEKFAASNTLPVMKSTEAPLRDNKAEQLLALKLEPIMTWAEHLPPAEHKVNFIHKPQRLLQRLWKVFYEKFERTFTDEMGGEIDNLARDCLFHILWNVRTSLLGDDDSWALFVFNPMNTAQTENVELKAGAVLASDVPPFGYKTFAVTKEMFGYPAPVNIRTERLIALINPQHEGILPLSASVITSSSEDFRLTAVKLPEESERDGMIVRGYNLTGEDRWVALTPWRPFAVVEVVTMDEVPAGGKLAAESNGAVQFKAGPHRILTFWFHD